MYKSGARILAGGMASEISCSVGNSSGAARFATLIGGSRALERGLYRIGMEGRFEPVVSAIKPGIPTASFADMVDLFML